MSKKNKLKPVWHWESIAMYMVRNNLKSWDGDYKDVFMTLGEVKHKIMYESKPDDGKPATQCGPALSKQFHGLYWGEE